MAPTVWLRLMKVRQSTSMESAGTEETVQDGINGIKCAQPLKQVDVGIEVSGTIKSVEVDYNATVKVGQVDVVRADITKAVIKSPINGVVLTPAKAFNNQTDSTWLALRVRNTVER